MKKQGKIKSKYERWTEIFKTQDISEIATDNIIDILLKNRKIVSLLQKKEFLIPKHPALWKLKDLGIDADNVSKTIKRLIKAVKEKEKIVIFGDYDVDGVTASAILWRYLYGIGADVMPYIPERFSEGYGIKAESIEKLKKENPELKLIITVDNGIIAYEAIKKANSSGIDTIVIDHHEKGKKHPDAFSVIHSIKLCGAGLVWMFVREMQKKNELSKYKLFKNGLVDDGKYTSDLEFATMGTIADQMSLTGINRAIVKFGLEKLNNTENIGLTALFKVAAIERGNVGTYEINYMIAPRLNAMGRLEHAIDSLRILCTNNRIKASQLALVLDRTNLKRQKIVENVLLKVKSFVSDLKKEKIIVVSGKDYHEGVIGLAASKITEEFYRPSIVLSEGPETTKGSARSINGFSIIKAIRSADKFLLNGGGHEMAAGFSISTGNIKRFKKQIKIYADKYLSSELLIKKLTIDLKITFSEISEELLIKIHSMEPFGNGNFAPLFLSENCKILEVKKVGKTGNHLKFKLENAKIIYDALCFSSPWSLEEFCKDDRLDIVYHPEENIWNGNRSIQLKIKDLRSSS